MKPTLLILAAGIGSRYGGIKQMDGIGPNNETIIDYSIYDAIRSGYGKVVFVINEKIEKDFKEIFEKKLSGKIKTDYVIQKTNNIPLEFKLNNERQKPWGTAHAVLVAASVINEPFSVINADDFYGYESFKLLADYLSNIDSVDSNEYCMAGYQLNKVLSENGSVSRGVCEFDKKDNLLDIKEITNIEIKDSEIGYSDQSNNWNPLTGNEIISMNFWGFTPTFFNFLKEYFVEFLENNYNNPKAEFLIPEVINNLLKTSQASTKMIKTNADWFGVTYKEDRNLAVEKLKKLIEIDKYPKSL
ncbi:MAG: nucleotidyltransferase [Bacteroidales bacterium]|nr:nucleotidyltransferase [Bacteroidales bacterium]